MTVKLSNDDRCAVDLLLDHAESPRPGISSCFSHAPSAAIQQRLVRVEQLLKQLDHHTAPDPGGDLLARTMARCTNNDSSAITPPDMAEAGGTRPLA